MFDLNKYADSHNSRIATTLNVVSGVVLFCVATWFSYTLFASRDLDLPPRLVNSIVLEPAILLPGQSFDAHINVTLSRLCPYEVHWSLVRAIDNVEVVKIVEPVREPPAQAGTQDIPSHNRVIPLNIERGRYKYVSEVYDLCPGGRTYTSVRRNVDITVR
jgi:hypothetical protein